MPKFLSGAGFFMSIIAILFIWIHYLAIYYDRGGWEFDIYDGPNEISRDISNFFQGDKNSCLWEVFVQSGINISSIGYDNDWELPSYCTISIVSKSHYDALGIQNGASFQTYYMSIENTGNIVSDFNAASSWAGFSWLSWQIDDTYCQQFNWNRVNWYCYGWNFKIEKYNVSMRRHIIVAHILPRLIIIMYLCNVLLWIFKNNKLK